MDIFKILGFILISAALCIILNAHRPEYSYALAVAAALAVLVVVIRGLSAPLILIQQKIEQSGIDGGYFKIALKAMGIAYLSSFIAQSCRDAGQSALALKAELAGKCAIFILSVPLILNILEAALDFLK